MINAMALYAVLESLLNIFVYIIVAVALVLAVFVHDVEFIKSSPVKFLVECVVIFIAAALPLLLFAKTQGVDWGVVRKWILSIGTKLVVLHILLTLSGMYTLWFEKEYSHGGERPGY
jgi:hypothetical protein